MNFLIDMNLPASWADFLTGAGHVAVDWSDEGHPDASDHDVFAWAAERDYIVVTADFDAPARGAADRAPGVIVLPCTALTPEALGHALLAAIHEAGAALSGGAVVAIAADTA